MIKQRNSGINVPVNFGEISIGVKWINKEGFHNVYCGRGSVFGNPYPISDNASRDEVCDKYEEYFKVEANKPNSALRNGMLELLRLHTSGVNINLQCYCAGKRCHCETIKRSLHTVAAKAIIK